jgi:hypothetical protein
LALATAVMRCGARSLDAIVQRGRLQPLEVRCALGFSGARMPGITTLHDVSKRLEVGALEAELQAWQPGRWLASTRQRVLDGKALRGIHREELPGVRLVALWAPRPASCWRK